MVITQFHKAIKVIRSDNGSQFFVLRVTSMKKGFCIKLLLLEPLNKMDEWNVNIVTSLIWHMLHVSKQIYKNYFEGSVF